MKKEKVACQTEMRGFGQLERIQATQVGIVDTTLYGTVVAGEDIAVRSAVFHSASCHSLVVNNTQ